MATPTDICSRIYSICSICPCCIVCSSSRGPIYGARKGPIYDALCGQGTIISFAHPLPVKFSNSRKVLSHPYVCSGREHYYYYILFWADCLSFIEQHLAFVSAGRFCYHGTSWQDVK